VAFVDTVDGRLLRDVTASELMLQTAKCYRGMVTAPHHLAAEAGVRVLRDGGNAIEAAVAAASTIAVVYPHMNGLGGDSFWLIHEPAKEPVGIDACGAAAGLADAGLYGGLGYASIPTRGPLAALTVAGAVSGWAEALDISIHDWGGSMPLARLLEDAAHHAESGHAVTSTLARNCQAKLNELVEIPGFATAFLDERKPPTEGRRFRQPHLASTLRALTVCGLDEFYRGEIARLVATDLEHAGSPIRLADLERHRARRVQPLSIDVGGHRVFNLPPPTQGLASLLLLGLYDRLDVREPDGFDYIHSLVEATKAAFGVRDRHVTDPDYMVAIPRELLAVPAMDELARTIDRRRASPAGDGSPGGDTVWLGVIDGEGRAVSLIQSLYWEFGSGVVLPGTGIAWQNRGISFALDPSALNSLKPHRRPFHTIQPAMAQLTDGRVMVYGTMGGDGQPQTQAIVFSRHVLFGQQLQAAVSGPRWLLGRTWGAEHSNLRIETGFEPAVIAELIEAGHDVEVVGSFEEIMGHAGALVRSPDGLIEGASDPRSDGAATGF
jgi:gamma-glutamyltranspeptidase/glutathione hydrolase